METKRRNRGGKRGTGGRNEKKNNEGEKANETKERIPRSFCLLRFLSRRKMKLLLYQSPFPFPRSSFSLRPGNEHPSLARFFLPFSVCYLFSLPVFLSIHPLSSSSSRLTFSRLPTFERAHASLVKFTRRRTKPTSSSPSFSLSLLFLSSLFLLPAHIPADCSDT